MKQCAGDARPRPGEAPRSAVDRLNEGDVEPYMLGSFYAARLAGKRFVSREKNVDHAVASLNRYRAVVADGEEARKTKNGLPEDFFEKELKMAREMVRLLPTKINHVRTKGGTIEDLDALM